METNNHPVFSSSSPSSSTTVVPLPVNESTPKQPPPTPLCEPCIENRRLWRMQHRAAKNRHHNHRINNDTSGGGGGGRSISFGSNSNVANSNPVTAAAAASLEKEKTRIRIAKCHLLVMLSLTFIFFIVEIVVGYFTNATTLIADSFHMLSDVVALVIAYVSVRISPKRWSKNTFGWARAEVLGALVNAVFLLALCFTILIESIKRLIQPERLHKPILVLTVGLIGLLINIVGLFLFHEHNLFENHDVHDTVNQVRGNVSEQTSKQIKLNVANQQDANPQQQQQRSTASSSPVLSSSSSKSSSTKSTHNMNMQGVFLHVLADALGSVIVVISALISVYVHKPWTIYVDPLLSMLIVIIIAFSTIPLLIDAALILLQTVPTHIKVDSLKQKLLQNIDGVLAVHEFHIWQLTTDRIIASAHIRCKNLHDYMQIAEKVKEFFHNEGIHSTTIQPEFVEFEQPTPPPPLMPPVAQQTQTSVSHDELGTSVAVPPSPQQDLFVPLSDDIWLANCAFDCPSTGNNKGTCVQNTCCGPQQLLRSSSNSISMKNNNRNT